MVIVIWHIEYHALTSDGKLLLFLFNVNMITILMTYATGAQILANTTYVSPTTNSLYAGVMV